MIEVTTNLTQEMLYCINLCLKIMSILTSSLSMTNCIQETFTLAIKTVQIKS